MFDVLELHRKLVAAARASGAERTGIGQTLAELARPFADEVTTDVMGNVICRKKGGGERIMLAAHMDAIGFMVRGIDENGFVTVTGIGGHAPARLLSCRVVFPNGTRGTFGIRERSRVFPGNWADVSFDNLYLDIGAADGEEARSLVKIGDTAVFEGEPRLAAGNCVMGPYADDLIGCVVLLLAMERLKESRFDAYFVFSVQEEVGCRGALSAAQAIRPAMGIACDVCGTDDTPEVKNSSRTLVLGNGPTVKLKDGSVLCDPALNAALMKAAREQGIAVQPEILVHGGTDTSAMQKALENVAATCVSIPTRHIHSPAETYDRSDAERAGALLAAFLSK